MRTAITIGCLTIGSACTVYLIGLMVSTVVEREIKRVRFTAREEIAVDTLHRVLQLQETSNEGWRKMADIAASASTPGRQPNNVHTVGVIDA